MSNYTICIQICEYLNLVNCCLQTGTLFNNMSIKKLITFVCSNKNLCTNNIII